LMISLSVGLLRLSAAGHNHRSKTINQQRFQDQRSSNQ